MRLKINIGILIISFLLLFIFVKETQASNATIVYRDNMTSIDTPIIREWNSSNGGSISKLVDISIIVKSSSTPRIQEAHRTIYHIICEQVEKEMMKK